MAAAQIVGLRRQSSDSGGHSVNPKSGGYGYPNCGSYNHTHTQLYVLFPRTVNGVIFPDTLLFFHVLPV